MIGGLFFPEQGRGGTFVDHNQILFLVLWVVLEMEE